MTPRVLTATALLIALLVCQGHAVMPPAPPNWHMERYNTSRPDGLKNGVPQLPPTLNSDLETAARKRPNNTDNLLLILVEFSDNSADQLQHPSSAYTDLIFSTGVIPTGSLYEYYQEVSYGAFAPAGTVTVWITAPFPYSYYTDGNFGFGSYPQNSQGLLEDCVEILDPTIDFSLFDNNGDGYAEGIFLVHAGPGGEETGDPNDIWSHAWSFETMTDDGVSTGRYSIEPEELLGGDMIDIGVFCHEYGHVLGLPDLYDTDGTSEGIGIYCLMSSGSWGALPGNPERPTQMCAEMKRVLGWITPIEINSDIEGLLLPPVETNPVCYKIDHPLNSNEYFLIENRAKIGYDSLFRGEGGLAIWHVDQFGWQSDEEHRYVSLEQADGNFDLERDYGTGNRHPRTNRGDAGDLYTGAIDNGLFSFSTVPNSMDYSESTDLMTIAGLNFTGDSIEVDVYVDYDSPLFHIADVTVFDTVSGSTAPNYNSDADSGEVVDLVLSIACDGSGSSGLTGNITSGDSRVNIIGDNAGFSSAAHGELTDNSSSPFRFQVLAGPPQSSTDTDSAATFTMTLDMSGGQQVIDFRVNLNRQRILLVLDNNGSHWSDNLVDAIHQAGYSFDVYSTSSLGTPTLDDLIPYHGVLWTNGSYFGKRTSNPDYEYCLTSAEKSVLESYLDSDGRVGLFSQDYIYDMGIDAFLSSRFMVQSVQQDEGSDSLTGVVGTFSTGYSGMARTWHFYDYTDFVNPSGSAVGVLSDDGTGQTVAINSISGDPSIGSPATTYSSFAIERLDDTSLRDFLGMWIEWILRNANVDVPLPISPKNSVIVSSSEPELLWTESTGATNYHLQMATDALFTNVVEETDVSGTSFITGTHPDGDYYWRVSAQHPVELVWTPYSPVAQFSIESSFVPGDANGSGDVDIDDVVFLITYIFGGGPPPDPYEAGDADCSGEIDIDDAVYLIAYIFSGGHPPVEC